MPDQRLHHAATADETQIRSGERELKGFGNGAFKTGAVRGIAIRCAIGRDPDRVDASAQCGGFRKAVGKTHRRALVGNGDIEPGEGFSGRREEGFHIIRRHADRGIFRILSRSGESSIVHGGGKGVSDRVADHSKMFSFHERSSFQKFNFFRL